MKIDGPVKEFVEQGEDAVVVVEGGQICQETHNQLDKAPVAGLDVLLTELGGAGEDLCGDFGLVGVGMKDDGGDEGNLERLLAETVWVSSVSLCVLMKCV